MPKVSIVLPNYNYARYLDERIQSLLNQTYSDFELIILDDASTDNSIEVIEKYTEDPRVKTKHYSENSGLPYKRWNDGADLAQGEYLLIAGADDSCHPTLLEKLVEKLDAYPSVGLALSQSLETDIDGNQVRSLIEWTNHLDQERWKADFVEEGKKEIQYLLFQCTIPNASNVLMRREVFIKAGKFDENLRLAADYLLWIKMLMISGIAFIAEPLNYFRRHAGTVTSSVARNGVQLEEILLVKQYLIKHFGSNFSRQDIEKAWEGCREEWFHLLVYSPRQVGLKRNLRIYRALSEVDSRVAVTTLLRGAKRLRSKLI
jgi:glycosyltransferase involved in cell wall biosynthesis